MAAGEIGGGSVYVWGWASSIPCPTEVDSRTPINQTGDSMQGDLIGDSLNL